MAFAIARFPKVIKLPSNTALSPTITPSFATSLESFTPRSIFIFFPSALAAPSSSATIIPCTSSVLVFTRTRLPYKAASLTAPILMKPASPLSPISFNMKPTSSMCAQTITLLAFSLPHFFTANTEPKLSYIISSLNFSK